MFENCKNLLKIIQPCFFFYFLRISLLCEGSLAFYLRRTVCISLHFIHAYKRASLEINRGVKDASALRETITMRVPAKTRDCRGSLKDERRASSLRTRTKHRRLKRTGTTRFTKNTWKNKLHSGLQCWYIYIRELFSEIEHPSL